MARSFTVAAANRIGCGDMGCIEGKSQFTLSAWIKRNAANAQLWIAKGDSATNLIQIAAFTGGQIFFTVANGGTSYVEVASALNDGNWGHACLVFDGTQGTANNRIKAYLNGVDAGGSHTGTHPTTSPTNAVDFTIGYRALSAIYSNGHIAEVKIWPDVALTANEVLSDYYGSTPKLAELIANDGFYMPLVGYDTEPDLSGNGRPGTLVNAPPISNHPWQTENSWDPMDDDIIAAVGGGGLLIHPGMDGLGGRYFNSKMNGGLNG